MRLIGPYPRGLAARLDQIPVAQLAAPPTLGDAVDAHDLGEQQRLAVAAGLGDAAQLQELAETDRLARDLDLATRPPGDLDEISTRAPHILMRPYGRGPTLAAMHDLLAIVLGIVAFGCSC